MPASPTKADEDDLVGLRGDAIVDCDGRRQMAVEVLDIEHRIQADWLAARDKRQRPWWRIWR